VDAVPVARDPRVEPTTRMFGALYALFATLAVLWGLLRFLIAAPAAIRADMEERRRRRDVTEAPRPGHIMNEAPRALPSPRPALPAAREDDVTHDR
jgi:hypothetical protein